MRNSNLTAEVQSLCIMSVIDLAGAVPVTDYFKFF